MKINDVSLLNINNILSYKIQVSSLVKVALASICCYVTFYSISKISCFFKAKKIIKNIDDTQKIEKGIEFEVKQLSQQENGVNSIVLNEFTFKNGIEKTLRQQLDWALQVQKDLQNGTSNNFIEESKKNNNKIFDTDAGCRISKEYIECGAFKKGLLRNGFKYCTLDCYDSFGNLQIGNFNKRGFLEGQSERFNGEEFHQKGTFKDGALIEGILTIFIKTDTTFISRIVHYPNHPQVN